ncbi:BrnA antitoxin family protein [Candidatus Poribacteria bacterium]|nr:BrnA antitoxin family protein [Candidatus Poribacteria bacterium]MYG05126.1 BrnA antitoxin family protein [Candidatus Poribacteria bacterium]MYK21413.1 BrnA antitoxin family protein [Candidatus Poribacteria bacterium]
MREPIAKRREREGKTFDTTHPLAEAIIKGWKTGSKKGSPVDCFVISPEFELMGRLLVNEFFDYHWDKFKRRDEESYLMFLKECLEGKQPGLGNITLNSEEPSQDVFDVFRTPTVGFQDYTVVVIDTRAFENGGTLNIDIETGRTDAEGLFYLVDGADDLPTTERVTKHMVLAMKWLEPDETGQLTYRFDRGQFFKLGTTGAHSRSEKGSINAFKAKISVAEYPQVESLEKEDPESDENIPEIPLSTLRLVLDKAQPSQEILDAFRAPGSGYQDYTVINIDTTAFEGSGTLIIDIRVGGADISGSFDLFDGATELPTEGYPDTALNSAWGISPGEAGKIRHRFARGRVFKLGATGDWYGEKGRINAFQARISVVEN